MGYLRRLAMSFFPDLGSDWFFGAADRLRTVGWLSPAHPVPTGTVPAAALDALRRHVATAYQPLAFAGWHDCEFCGRCKGYGNLWVPTPDVVYVAPEMIVHYAEHRGYRPPDGFCEAVLACPTQGGPAYMRLLAPYLPYFGCRGADPLPTPEQQAELARLVSRVLRDIERLCRAGEPKAAAALAGAFAELPERMHGWGLWYRHVFSRLVRNGRADHAPLAQYLAEYNSIFGEDTDPELTAYEAAQARFQRDKEARTPPSSDQPG